MATLLVYRVDNCFTVHGYFLQLRAFLPIRALEALICKKALTCKNEYAPH